MRAAVLVEGRSDEAAVRARAGLGDDLVALGFHVCHADLEDELDPGARHRRGGGRRPSV